MLSEVGTAAGVFYGYKTDGVFSTTEEADAAALYQIDETGAKTYFRAGDMKFVDGDGNHIINEKDMQVIGDPNPDLYGNIFTNVRWKNLSLDVVFNYSLGNDVYNYQAVYWRAGHVSTTRLPPCCPVGHMKDRKQIFPVPIIWTHRATAASPTVGLRMALI